MINKLLKEDLNCNNSSSQNAELDENCAYYGISQEVKVVKSCVNFILERLSHTMTENLVSKLLKKSLITALVLISFAAGAGAESLFTLGASQTYAPVPKSLYGGVQARSVGDLISIIMDETVLVSNTLSYNSGKKSETTDNFSKFFNTVLGRHLINDNLGTFGGSNKVANSADQSNKMSFGDKIAVQVVQQMPNGNLVVQGKKTLVNGNERSDLLVSGIVDPHWISSGGQVYSKNVANLQFAVSGRGAISRSSGDGIVNRFIKYLF